MFEDALALLLELFANLLVVARAPGDLLLPLLDGAVDPIETLGLVEELALLAVGLEPLDLALELAQGVFCDEGGDLTLTAAVAFILLAPRLLSVEIELGAEIGRQPPRMLAQEPLEVGLDIIKQVPGSLAVPLVVGGDRAAQLEGRPVRDRVAKSTAAHRNATVRTQW